MTLGGCLLTDGDICVTWGLLPTTGCSSWRSQRSTCSVCPTRRPESRRSAESQSTRVCLSADAVGFSSVEYRDQSPPGLGASRAERTLHTGLSLETGSDLVTSVSPAPTQAQPRGRTNGYFWDIRFYSSPLNFVREDGVITACSLKAAEAQRGRVTPPRSHSKFPATKHSTRTPRQ